MLGLVTGTIKSGVKKLARVGVSALLSGSNYTNVNMNVYAIRRQLPVIQYWPLWQSWLSLVYSPSWSSVVQVVAIIHASIPRRIK
jgi:hypothetical protein